MNLLAWGSFLVVPLSAIFVPFARTGRIFFPMAADAAFALTALALIYWNLEFDVAHLTFK